MHVYRNLSQTHTPLGDPTALLCHEGSAGSFEDLAAVNVVRFAAESFGTAARRVRLVLLLVALVTGARGFAAVYQVPTSSYPTITEALAVADNGDTVLVAAGTYSAPGESFPLRL